MEAHATATLMMRGDPRPAPTDRRIGVLFVMIQMAMGGSERLILNLVRNLDRRIFRPSIAWFAEGRVLPEFQELGVPLHGIPKRRRFDWTTMRRLAAIIRTHQIDVVNAHHFMPCFYAYYGTKIANRARLVYTEHSEADVLAARGRWQTIGGCMLRASDVAIGISPRVSQTLQSHFGLNPRSIHTIENGVDVRVFGDGAIDRDILRQQLGFSAQDVIIGTVANFRRNKNHVFLLKAFNEVAQRRPDVKLVLVGQGFPGDPENSEQEIARFIQSVGLSRSVRMLGYRSDVHDLLRMLDVFCLVSYKEGLPLSLIEAMASGLPVVGTDIEGIRAVVEPETNGLLASPDDIPGLVSALHRLAADPALRQRMGQAARRRATEKYSLTRCVQETQDLFLSLVPDRTLPLHSKHGCSTA
jgi:glycosyltransferase involved in cell wall biosynthesis